MDEPETRSFLRRLQSCSAEDPRSVEGVAATVGKLATKVITLESALEVVTKKALTLERDFLSQKDLSNKCNEVERPFVVAEIHGHDVMYWNQVATTLYNETALVRREIENKVEAYRVLQENHIRLGMVHRQAVEEIAVLSREIALLRVDPKRNDTGTTSNVGKFFPSVPVNPQGRDAVFWHQCARTLQQQFLDLNKEFEEKVSQHAVVTENTKSVEAVCKEKDVIISGLEDHVKKLLEHRSVLEGQLKKLFK